ncbi:MAG: alternate F1F0 ATPase, F1 subunit alpha [Lewinella sp.]|nr:alternate F1F0 ATPase, F1 subunit alpha [Lewinella sp.]
MSTEHTDHPLDTAFTELKQARDQFEPPLALREVGEILTVFNGIARVRGIPGVGYEELLRFPGGCYGLAFNLDESEVGTVLLGDYTHLRADDKVDRTRRLMYVPVSEALIWRVITPLGQPLDGRGTIDGHQRWPIERPAPAIMDRAPVNAPLQTGVKVIDALVPVGRGQRELILGDRQTGKTAIALDAIINQRDEDVLCIYCAIGQRAAAVARAIETLRAHGAMEHSIVVVTEGNDPAGLTYIAPYAATTIGEYFMRQGRDVLIVYDDLTQHARAYREISLLLRRPPGREAFPGDIFYIHSRLLERSTHLREELGHGSLTALPIIETEAQNMAAYIPTNLISITDGQIYLSPTLFELGILPAVDIGRSVSRVGDKAQLAVYRAATAGLKLEHAQFEELENFARFGTRLDEQTKQILRHGRRIRAVLKQPEGQPVPVPEQITLLLALRERLFDDIVEADLPAAEGALRQVISQLPEAVSETCTSGKTLTEEDQQLILAKAKAALQTFNAES